MIKKFGRSIYIALIALLLINLVLPSTIVSAAEERIESIVVEAANQDLESNKLLSEGNITENLITSVVIKDEAENLIENVRPDQGARVEVTFEWKLPENHGYREGASFTFHLPDKFKLDSRKTGDLDGGVGTYVVTPEGEITLTFNEEINDQNELTGHFFVWRSFDASKFDGGTHQEVVFKFNETEETTIPVHFKSKSNSEMNKSGTANKGMNASEIKWVVDFNKDEKKIEGANFKDVFLPKGGLQLDQKSVEVYPLVVNLDGSVTEGSERIDLKPKVENNVFELFFGDIEGAYRVKYTTKITKLNDVNYENKATISGKTGDIMDKSAKVNVKFSKPLDKKSTNYESATQTITWAVQYNYNEQGIKQADAWINDTFDVKHQQLVENSFKIYEMKINDDGSAVRKTGEALVKDTDYVVNKTADGFKLEFLKGISTAHEIFYQTSAINRVHEDGYKVDNKVEIFDGTKVTKDREINQVIFKKWAGKVDYAAKTIEWHLSLNEDQKKMEKVIIEDSFADKGLTLLPETMKVSGLDLGEGYTLDPNPVYDEGFKLEFNAPTSSSHVITYKTSFDPTRFHTGTYNNSAVLNWDEDGVAQNPITKSAVVTPDNYTKENGNKTGTYDAKTKEITWTIDVNYNLHKINDAIIRDFYIGQQKFLKETFTVHKLTLTGTDNGVTSGGEVSSDKYTLETKTEDGKDGFVLKLGEIDSAYRITYKTSLKGLPVVENYSNAATLQDGETGELFKFNKGVTVKPLFAEEYVDKTGKQGTDANSDFADWEVNINRSLSHIEVGAVLTDLLSSNQILVKESFELYNNIVDSIGNLRKGSLVDNSEYTLDVQGNSFKLLFKNAIESSYLLVYQSFINADHGDVINNKVSFQGQSSGTVDKNEQTDIKVEFSGAGGGANSPGKGNLKVLKIDADSKTPLEGARFGLYDKTGSNLLEELTTNADGVAEFEGYKYKDYMLKELDAPAGYLIAPEYKTGKVLKFKADATDFTVENVKGNWDVELTKVDQEESTRYLEEAVFKLQFLENGSYHDVAGQTKLSTDSSGKIQLTDLKPGSYQFIEVKAPKGYKLDATPIPFTIDADQSEPKLLVAQNEIYIGSVELLKIDADTGSRLEGAEFELWDADGGLVKDELITDQEGKLSVDQLKAGSYQFVEIKAPEDYQLNMDPISFEIIDDSKVNVEFKNTMKTGSVKLTKIEQDKPDVKLSGAEFRVLNVDKIPVTDSEGTELAGLTTDDNGELFIPELRPGTYFLEETKAPSGYIKKDQWIEIKVAIGEETAVTVENVFVPYTSGGGGEEYNPNPPVDTTPEQPVDPKPELPSVDPSEPGQPGESIDPVGPTNPTDPTDPTDPNHPSEGTDSNPVVDDETVVGNENSGGTSNQGSKPNKNQGNELIEGANSQQPSGNVLPKTGEESRLPFQMAGFGLILIGLGLLVARKKQWSIK